jgi:hypothetical protein
MKLGAAGEHEPTGREEAHDQGFPALGRDFGPIVREDDRVGRGPQA